MDDLELLTTLNQRYNSVPAVVLGDADLRELLTPALRADMTLVETYVYRPEEPFTFPVRAFGGNEDRMVGRPELEQWRTQTTDAFHMRMLDGDHLFLQDMRQVLLAEISDAMRVQGDRIVSSAVR
jgi:surfactin synthase thioesterase subunit